MQQLFKTTDTGNTCNPYLRLMGDLQKLNCLANMFSFGFFKIRYLLFFITLSLFCGKMCFPGQFLNVHLETWDWVLLFIRFNFKSKQKCTIAKKKSILQAALPLLWVLMVENPHMGTCKTRIAQGSFRPLRPKGLCSATDPIRCHPAGCALTPILAPCSPAAHQAASPAGCSRTCHAAMPAERQCVPNPFPCHQGCTSILWLGKYDLWRWLGACLVQVFLSNHAILFTSN